LDGNIVVHKHRPNIPSLSFGFLRSEAEVELITSVVFDNEESAISVPSAAISLFEKPRLPERCVDGFEAS
jgi:hypothetical protein